MDATRKWTTNTDSAETESDASISFVGEKSNGERTKWKAQIFW